MNYNEAFELAVHRNDEGGIVGQGGIKPDTFYSLNGDGKPIEVK
jgi:hypothetical protein